MIGLGWRSVQRVRLVGVRNERRPGEGAHAVVCALALLCLASPVWAQSAQFPDGDLFSPSDVQSGMVPDSMGMYQSAGIAPTNQGDNRQGWGAVGGQGYIRDWTRPRETYLYGDVGFSWWFECDATGLGAGLNIGARSTPLRWIDIGPPDNTVHLPDSFAFGGVELNAWRMPPGLYTCWVKATSYKGETYEHPTTGWYCPLLHICHVKILKPDGRPAAGVLVEPVTRTAAFPNGYYARAWKRFRTGADGTMDFVAPQDCDLTFRIEESQGNWSGGVCTGGTFVATGPLWDQRNVPPTTRLLVQLHNTSLPEFGVEVATPQPSPTPSASGGGSGSGTGNTSSGFWVDLWKPDAAKLNQFSGQRAWWEAWGPFGLGNQILGIWSTAALATDEAHKWDGLAWRIDGPLGLGSADFRPQKAEGEGSYPDGTRGTVAGNVVQTVRVGVGLVVWAMFVFGLYKVLRPRITT